jgi:hypothetical protein
MKREAHFFEIDGGPSGTWWEANVVEGKTLRHLTYWGREQAFKAARNFALEGWTVSLSTADLYYAAEEAGTI